MKHVFRISAMSFALSLLLSGAHASNLNALEQATSFGGVEKVGGKFILAQPNLSKIKFEDSKANGGPYRYGVQVPFGAKTAAGDWSHVDSKTQRWSIAIASPGATSLDFHFSKLVLPENAVLRIIGAGDGNERKVQASEINSGADYWTPYVLGDSATIQIDVPSSGADKLQLEIADATHGYRGLFERSTQKSGSCNVDTACPAGDAWRDQIDSVGHYTFSSGGSSYVCTGTLIGNTAQNTTPYFLTANHCVSTAAVASTLVVYWNYQSATCRTPGSSSSGTSLSRSIATHSQSGATLTSTNAASDFALLRLNSNVPAGANPYWSGWDASGTTPTSAVGIHHPAGHEKRIAVEDQALTISGYSGAAGTTHWRVGDWDQGTTEGGSSGSGLWNQNKRLVGQLHGGLRQ